MLKWIHKGDLSVLILPAFIKILKVEGFMNKEQFNTYVWSHIARLCHAGELPAQALYMLVDNLELFFSFINAGDFQSTLFPLLLKSLEWGVHKLQHLAIKKVPFLSKKIEYMTFKTQLMPRFLTILTNQDIPLNLKENGCEVLIEILTVLDRNFLRDNILKTLHALRDSINEPSICMHILTLYSGIADTLTPEDIGNKILPGLIPMLISASFTKVQFNKLVSTIRQLIDQLEKHRLKDLSEMDPLGGDNGNSMSNQKDIFAGLSSDDPLASLPPQESRGEFDFLSQIEGTAQKQVPIPSGIESAHSKASPSSDPFSSFGGTKTMGNPPQNSTKNDIFKGIRSTAGNPVNEKPINAMTIKRNKTGGALDPFNTSSPSNPLHFAPAKENKSDIFSDMDPFGAKKNNAPKPVSTDPFSNLGGSNQVSGLSGMPSVSINMSTGFKSMKDGTDPFADIENEEIKAPSMTGADFDFSSGIGNKPKNPSSSFGQNSLDLFSNLGGAKIQKANSGVNQNTGLGFWGNSGPKTINPPAKNSNSTFGGVPGSDPFGNLISGGFPNPNQNSGPISGIF